MIRRTLAAKLTALARTFPIVTVTGPRQSGKTTLCRACFPDKAYVSLEAPDLRDHAHRGIVPNLSFCRDRKGVEVDAVLERGNELLAVETKSAQTVADDFFAALRAFATAVSAPMRARRVTAMLVYGGTQSQRRAEAAVVPWCERGRCARLDRGATTHSRGGKAVVAAAQSPSGGRLTPSRAVQIGASSPRGAQPIVRPASPAIAAASIQQWDSSPFLTTFLTRASRSHFGSPRPPPLTLRISSRVSFRAVSVGS